MTPRRLQLLGDVSAAKGPGGYELYVYAYLPMWKHYQGVTWDDSRMYVATEFSHLPGACSGVTAAARWLIAAGFVELGPSGRRAERPLVLTDAGRERLAELDGTTRP